MGEVPRLRRCSLDYARGTARGAREDQLLRNGSVLTLSDRRKSFRDPPSAMRRVSPHPLTPSPPCGEGERGARSLLHINRGGQRFRRQRPDYTSEGVS
jgi:hypothetical protein